MEVVKFKELLNNCNGIQLDENNILFIDFEIYNMLTDKEYKYKTLEEALEHKIGTKKVKEIIEETEDFTPQDNGGRGAGSSSGEGTGIFSGQRAKHSEGVFAKGTMPPAYINSLTSGRFKSVNATAKAFGKKTLNALKEYSGALNEDGFATQYAEGNKGSTLHLVEKDGYSIHNHPTKDKNGKTIAWNIYSKKDLINTANDNARGTIVVSNGNRTMYKFTKTKTFDGKKFIKGLNKAKSTETNYDKALDGWLKKNQKTYGYKYTKSKF